MILVVLASGAELRNIISNGSISSVEVVNSGIGYSSIDSSILITPSGKNALLRSSVRELTINDSKDRFSNGESLLNGKYSAINYFSNLRDSFKEDGTKSGIIGGLLMDIRFMDLLETQIQKI